MHCRSKAGTNATRVLKQDIRKLEGVQKRFTKRLSGMSNLQYEARLKALSTTIFINTVCLSALKIGQLLTSVTETMFNHKQEAKAALPAYWQFVRSPWNSALIM